MTYSTGVCMANHLSGTVNYKAESKRQKPHTEATRGMVTVEKLSRGHIN